MKKPFTKGNHHIGLTVSNLETSAELAKHMMCYEPSGIRIEFIWLGN